MSARQRMRKVTMRKLMSMATLHVQTPQLKRTTTWAQKHVPSRRQKRPRSKLSSSKSRSKSRINNNLSRIKKMKKERKKCTPLLFPPIRLGRIRKRVRH